MADKNFKINGAEEFYKSLIDHAPQWFAKFRNDSLEASRSISIPTVKDEEWKYTSLALLANHDYELPTHHDLEAAEQLWQYADKEDIHFVMVNGCFVSELSNFDGIEGLNVLHLQEAVNQGLMTEAHYKATTKNDIQPFLAINNAYHRCGAYINVNKKFNDKRLIHIVHINTLDKPYTISPRSAIFMERSSQARILESHISLTDSAYFVNALTDVYLDENSNLQYVKTQKESFQAVHIGQTRVWQKRDSQFKTFSFVNGSKITRNNLSIILEGEGTHTILNGLSLIQDDRHVDMHSFVHHLFPNCESSQLYKALLTDKGRSVFNGKIHVKDIAQQTNAYQLNKALLLGKDCRVDTKPELEIFADDVKCSHGAAIGQLDEDEVFYLQTRGIARETAVEMLSEGFINDVLDSIESDAIRVKVDKLR